jgi:hypothetical protein
MKKFIALILTVATLLTFTLPAYAASAPPAVSPRPTMAAPTAESRLRALTDFISANYRFLSDASKTELAALKPLIADWKDLTAEQQADVRSKLQDLVTKMKTEVADNKAKLAALLKELGPLFKEIRANNVQLAGLSKDNKTLRISIRAKLNYWKEDPAFVMSDELKALFADLKDKTAELTGTKGDIRDLLEGNKINRETFNLTGIEKAFKDIIKIQEARIEILKSINGILTDIDGALPAIPAPTPTPSI